MHCSFTRIQLFLAVFLLLGSCDQKIEIDLSEYENRVMVQCILQPGMPVQVLLTKGKPLLSEVSADDQPELVLDAKVSIRHNQQVYQLSLSNQEYFEGYTPVPGTPNESGGPSGLIFYQASFPIVHGETYHLEIQYEDQLITAQTTVPIPVPISNIEMTTADNGTPNPVTVADIHFTDRAGEENAYIYDVFFVADRLRGQYIFEPGVGPIAFEFTDTVPTPIYWKVWEAFRSDEGLDGEAQEIRVWPPSYLSGIPEMVTDTMDIRTMLSVDIRLYTGDKDLQRFLQSMQNQPWVPQTPFVSPIRIWSNINGGIGIFTAVGLSEVKTFTYEVAYGSGG